MGGKRKIFLIRQEEKYSFYSIVLYFKAPTFTRHKRETTVCVSVCLSCLFSQPSTAVYPALSHSPALLSILFFLTAQHSCSSCLMTECSLPNILERKCDDKYLNVTLFYNLWNNILFTYCINCR